MTDGGDAREVYEVKKDNVKSELAELGKSDGTELEKEQALAVCTNCEAKYKEMMSLRKDLGSSKKAKVGY